MRKIYIVNGEVESGKTTIGKLVGKELRERGISFLHASSIDPVKSILQPFDTWGPEFRSHTSTLLRLKSEVTNLDWSGKEEDKTPYWRKAMSNLKAKITENDPLLIHELVLNKFKNLGDSFVGFVDIREPENIQAFQEHCDSLMYGIKTAKILIKSDKSKQMDNRSDMSVNETQYDIVIDNTRSVFVSDEVSYWFLRAKVRTFVEQEILEGRPKERFY